MGGDKVIVVVELDLARNARSDGPIEWNFEVEASVESPESVIIFELCHAIAEDGAARNGLEAHSGVF